MHYAENRYKNPLFCDENASIRCLDETIMRKNG